MSGSRIRLDASVVATKLRQMRERSGMTQQQLATALGCYQPLISRYERGQTKPTIERFKMIARILARGRSEK